MMDSVDFIQNYAIISNTRYDLDEIRQHLLENNSVLCSNHFVKVIKKQGKDFFSYDWQSILEIASFAGYLRAFHKQKIQQNEQV